MGFFDRVKDALTSADAERTRKKENEAAVAEPPSGGAVATPAGGGDGVAGTGGATASREAGDPAPGRYRTYTVRTGDTLPGIAEQHGVDWREMARLNKLDNPDLIYPGQVFKIPDG